MNRRRLQIVCSSDEEEEDVIEQQQPQQIINDNEDIETTDDIEMEVQESTINFRTVTINSTSNNNPSPTPNHEPIQVVVDNVSVAADCAIGGVLQGLGLRLQREWLEACVRGLAGSVRGFSSFDDTAKAKLCLEQFLYADMNYCGAGVLPRDVHKLHLVDLKGPFVLQVDEIVNISCPLRDRYQKAAAGIKRCLKLSMTDGIQRVFGMEYRPIKDLDVLAPAGLKVALCNVNVRHGLLMLVPEVIEVLGGMVDELEGARQRLVNEVNKPPRGKRTRTGEVPPLTTRATCAAWPPEGVNAPEHVNTSTRESSMPPQVHEQGTIPGIVTGERIRGEFATPISRGNAGSSFSSAATFANTGARIRGEFATPISRGNAGSSFSSTATVANTGFRNDAAPHHPSTADIAVVYNEEDAGTNHLSAAASRHEDSDMVDMTAEDMNVLLSMEHAEPMRPSTTTMDVEEIPSDVGNGPTGSDSGRSREQIPFSSVHMENADTDTISTAAIDVDDIDSIDELEHPFILSGEKENPFTYLASLSAKHAGTKGSATNVEGKIKCFLTGVKGFQYKGRSKYELRAYIDDGSLISEILIDHDLVQKGIGFSPAEVTTALSSSDSKRVSDMKDTLKRFQKFLVNFEGTMLVKMTDEHTIPVAIEMDQGCPASDAWLLLKRLKSSTSSRPHHLHRSETINLSP